MGSILCLIILGLVGYIVYSAITKSGFFDGTVNVLVDGFDYRVIENMPNKEEAAKRLREIDIRIKKIIEHIDNKFSDSYILSEDLKNRGKGEVLKKIKRRLLSTYNQRSLKEN